MNALGVLLAGLIGIVLLGCCVIAVARAIGEPDVPGPQPEDAVAEVLLHTVQRDRKVSSARHEMHHRFEAQMRRWQDGDWSLPDSPDDPLDEP